MKKLITIITDPLKMLVIAAIAFLIMFVDANLVNATSAKDLSLISHIASAVFYSVIGIWGVQYLIIPIIFKIINVLKNYFKK